MFRAKIKDSNLDFGPAQRAVFKDFLTVNEGRTLIIELEKPRVSDAMRGYMFGAVIPFLRRLVPAWAAISDEQVYEILKKNFNYFEAYNPLTQRNERYGQSVMARSNNKEPAKEFIQEIEVWVMENYAQHLPDPEKYKKWKDGAPLQGERYNSD